jgi:RIO kinase 1
VNNRYDEYEDLFDPMANDRQARRKRKAKPNHKPKKAESHLRVELADNEHADGVTAWTYQPSRFEEGWLGSSLEPFFYQELITDVLSNVKGGKEASVYSTEAHPNTGFDILAAKVYRPHEVRKFRNDAVYREGRAILTEDGREAKKTDHRLQRALNKKSTFGNQVAHTSWLMYEYNTLNRLYNIGASVPQPLSAAENAILMEFIGDEDMPAPILASVMLESREVEPLFNSVMHNLDIMLQNDMIHGDLSSYNILYWEGRITLIDFPQVTNARANRQARQILERDITRICEYFDGQGLVRDPHKITRELWNRYFYIDAKQQKADESRLQLEPDQHKWSV